MSRRKKDPLRELTADERQELTRLARSHAAPAAEVIRAKLLLAVAGGDDYQAAARAVGRRSGDAVSHLVARFNAEGLAALAPRHGGGRRPTYGPQARGRIVAEAGPGADPRGRRHRDLVALGPAPDPPRGPRRPAPGLDLHHPPRAPGVRGQLPAHPHLVPDRHGPAAPQGRAGGRRRPGRRARKKVDRGRLPHSARRWGWRSGAPTRPGPYQTIPYAGQSWRPEGEPARLPHEYLRDGTAKVLTLFHPADGRVRLHGVTACPNAVLHPWLKRELADILAGAARAAGRARRGVACGLGAVAGGADDQADAAGRAAAAADAPGAGQPGRAQDAGVRLLAVRARDHAAVHAGGRARG